MHGICVSALCSREGCGTLLRSHERPSPKESKRRLIHWLPSVWRPPPSPTRRHMCSYTRVLACTQTHRHTCVGNFAAVTNAPKTMSHSRLLPIIYTRPAAVCFAARSMDFSPGRAYRASKRGNRKVSIFQKKRFLHFILFSFQPIRCKRLDRSCGSVVFYLKNTAYDVYALTTMTTMTYMYVMHVFFRFWVRFVRSVRSNSER